MSVPKKALLGLTTAAAVLAVAEAALRLAGFRYRPRQKKFDLISTLYDVGTHEWYRPTFYVPNEFLWLPYPNNQFSDEYGFRRPGIVEPKRKGIVRVAFLGGSTTEGGYHPYAERAIRLLNAALGTNRYEMLNAACSGYSSMHSRRVLERKVLDFRPDWVVNYDGWNEFACWEDGYSDAEKDRFLKAGMPLTGAAAPRWLSKFRLYQALGWCVDRADLTWPRLRMSEAEFRENLREMARRCQERNIPFLVILRPYSHRRPLPHEHHDEAIMRRMGFTDKEQLYRWRHERTLAIQREVLEEFENARACDAWSFFEKLQADQASGLIPTNLEIFSEDACHIRPYAEERLGEFVALHIAPEHEREIRQYVNSFGYYLALAEESLAELLLPEASYYLDCAQRANPGADLSAYRRRVEAETEFVRLFREGRRWGTDEPLDVKLGKLRRCLELKPDDLGVVIQIFYLCRERGELGKAASAMAGFRPRSPEDQYAWLLMSFASHWEGGRREEALHFGRRILQMNPGQKDVAEAVAALSRAEPPAR